MRKIIWSLLILLLIFVVGSCILGPLLPAPPSRPVCTDVLPENACPERVLCVDDNQDALIRRLQLIEDAREELILATYSFKNDDSGQDIMAALLQAANRGVKVRILVDGISAFLDLSGSRQFCTLTACPNVEVRAYNFPSLTEPWKLNYRMHDKYMIADQNLYLLGGRNTRNVSLGSYKMQQDVDRDMLVYSPGTAPGRSLQQVSAYFETVWNQQGTTAFSGHRRAGAREELEQRYAQLQKQYPEAFCPPDWEAITMETRGVQLLCNPTEPTNKEPLLWKQLTAQMEQGRAIRIQTPYVICGESMYRDLENLCDQGKQIDIVVNAPETGANPCGCADYLNQKQHILATGCGVLEYVGDRSSHTKTLLIDDSISIVGSFNLDMRSAYLDTEMMLRIDCPELNRLLWEESEAIAAHSRRILPNGSAVPGPQCMQAEMGPGKRFTYGVLRILTAPVRYLL